ncbi:RNA polymerase sigma factor, sigma-70 family [Ruminococcaceae bacterium FB2012]|nr:RNA polymerase sigma factor, sigma-70 family [Ruminococcaceae bacterium FB2012]
MKTAESKTLRIYDTISGKTVYVDVTAKVYEAYMRTEWNIHDNNETFYEHEIQFSMLKGGEGDWYENFREFVNDSEMTAVPALYDLRAALSKLKSSDRKLIHLIYFCEYTEQECAKLLATSQQNIHKKKKRILANIHKLLEK